ncbi:MAG: FecR domain-containing protein [Chitinophagaceae bacterium]
MQSAGKKEQLQYLLLRFLEDKATDSERAQFFHYLSQENDDEGWTELMEELLLVGPEMKDYDRAKWQPVIDEVIKRNAVPAAAQAPVRRIGFFRRYGWWAAAVLLLAVAGFFLLDQPSRTGTPGKATLSQLPGGNDIMPGNNKAILTLSSGKAIVLDNAAKGKLAEEGNAEAIKLEDGRVVYRADDNRDGEIVFNTMSTPRGGQYRLTLPDGTEVWLNAASSITYPTSFTGSERRVTITGEVYFEVAKNAAMPFRVKANDVTVEVLGTHFNINAYRDEALLKTTLLEGSVKIISRNASGLLSPGQQAHVNDKGNIRLVQGANTEEAMAWKNGKFYFDGADIQSIMRQVARWYDVKISYEKQVPHGHYKGKPSRNLTLLQMLKVFEYSGLKFRLEGNTMIVME